MRCALAEQWCRAPVFRRGAWWLRYSRRCRQPAPADVSASGGGGGGGNGGGVHTRLNVSSGGGRTGRAVGSSGSAPTAQQYVVHVLITLSSSTVSKSGHGPNMPPLLSSVCHGRLWHARRRGNRHRQVQPRRGGSYLPGGTGVLDTAETSLLSVRDGPVWGAGTRRRRGWPLYI